MDCALYRCGQPRLVDGLVFNGRLGRGIDLDRAGLLALGQFALQFQMQQAMLKVGALDLDIIGKLETQLESAFGNAAMEEFTGLVGFRHRLGALDHETVFLGLDGDVTIGKAGDGNRDAVGVLARALDIVGRIGLGFLPDERVEAIEDAVETDSRTIEGGKIDGLHSHILRKATWMSRWSARPLPTLGERTFSRPGFPDNRRTRQIWEREIAVQEEIFDLQSELKMNGLVRSSSVSLR